MKKIIALSSIVALATVGFASTNVETRLEIMENKISKLEKKLIKANKKLNKVKAHDAGDNIKWDVDFRTSVDRLSYDHASGKESKNGSLMTNRLLLGMKFQADENVLFYGTLGYNKAYGDTMNHSQSNTNPGYANFDWVTNENATDNTVKVKEAYWMYMNNTFMGKDIPWTASVGRRPSTGGLGINFREGDQRKSALAHTVNVEFDGASFKWTLDKVTPLVGSWFKLCMGRGLTNATQRFQNDGSSYANNTSTSSHQKNIDMKGFIFVPYDDGQYSIHTNYATANDLIGFASNGTTYMSTSGNYDSNYQTIFPAFKSFGDLELITAMVKVDGIGDGINDYLDETIIFASFAQSKTKPKSFGTGETARMLGSTKSETGNSIWLGVQMPCLLSEDGRIGVEWNKGSKYWRSMTYGEDTMSGSKIATRGTALEVYWLKPLTKALSMNVRYTKIDYDYTGSQAFFGDDGTPTDMSTITAANAAMYGDPVKSSTDMRVSMRYRF